MGTFVYLSTMIDDIDSPAGQDNIRGLIQDISEKFDQMADVLRQDTRFADTRPADAKTFMLISRAPRGLSDLARALNISRQATHKSVQRLMEVGVIEFEYVDGSKRDKIARLTVEGLKARKIGLHIASQIEAFVDERVGEDGRESLRALLQALK